MPQPAVSSRRMAVAVRAMAHHRKLAQTVEMIELLCVMLRGYFAECASVPHAFLERHLPEYNRHLHSEEEEEGEEEGVVDELAESDFDVAPVVWAHLARKLHQGRAMTKAARAIHTPPGQDPPVMMRSRARKRPASRASKAPAPSAGELRDRSRSAIGEPTTTTRTSTPAPSSRVGKVPKRLPPRAMRNPEPADLMDENARTPCEAEGGAAFKTASGSSAGVAAADVGEIRQLFKTASKKSKKSKPLDMPVLTE